MTNDHGRSKYLRDIYNINGGEHVVADVYCVLEAFAVTCPARQHAVKKLLCAGIRGKGNSIQDLEEAKVAIDRAIHLETIRLGKEPDKKVMFNITEHPDASMIDKPGLEVFKQNESPLVVKQGWSVFAVMDDRGVNPVGYRVGWRCKNGKTFLVAHYLANEAPNGSPSLGWCLNAAEQHAKRFNEEGKRPEEWGAFHELKLEETKTDV